MNPDLDTKNWHRLLLPYVRPDLRKSTRQLVTTLVPYAAFWLAMLWSLGLSYWLTLALAIPAAAMRVRAFVLFHDCCHGSFFRSRKANERVGAVLGVLGFTPFYYWRHDHLIHHATAANLDKRGTGDVPTWTVEEYRTAPLYKRLAYRILRNPFFLFAILPTLVFLLVRRFPSPGADRALRRSVLFTDLGLAAFYLALALLVGLKALLLIEAPIIVLSAGAGVWLFYMQHQFEGVYWARTAEWSFLKAGLEGSSYYQLPPLLDWVTGSIGFHHIHHLSPKIPNYYLAKCHRENPPLQVKPLTIRNSLKSCRLHLWDEENRRLVGFKWE
jgi:omega-6 fatty acid desaturase (delta-12 desaturase)